MRPFQPIRALVAGATVAGPLALLTGLVCALETTAPHAWIALLALPFVTAFVTAWFVHAIEAILVTTLLTLLGVCLIGVLVIGMNNLIALLVGGGLGMWMFGAAVAGAILGLFVRPLVRKWFKL